MERENMELEFKDFTNTLVNEVLERTTGTTVFAQEVMKNNNQMKTGIVIKSEGVNIAPTIYIEELFDRYMNGYPIQDIAEEVISIWKDYSIKDGFDTTQLTDYENVKDRVICKLISREKNQGYLSDKPHKVIADLAVVYAVSLGDVIGQGGLATAPVTNTLFQEYGVDLEELHKTAVKNAVQAGVNFVSLSSFLASLMGPMFDEIPEDAIPLHILSCNAPNGAVAILDEEVMDQVAEKFGGDFLILPSSIHEVLVLPIDKDKSVDEMKSIVMEVNSNQVAPEERLSDHVYMYNAKDRRLVIAR